MIDILTKLINEEISKEEAYQIFDEIVEKFHAGQIKNPPNEEMCMNNFEWTAVMFGIDLAVLADWRKGGWPKSCSNCNKTIDYTKFGWIIKANNLKCLEC